MQALTQRRVAGFAAILVLLFTMQAVIGVPAEGVEDPTCQKVEGADLGVEGLQITVDGHVDVTFYDWVGTSNEYASVTVDVTGLADNEDLAWSTKAGSAAGDTLETNSGVIPEDGTYTIGRAADATRAISHITMCVVETSVTTVPTTVTTVPTTVTTVPTTVTTVPTTVTTVPTTGATTPEVTATTAAADGEVLGTTVTAPPDVTADTLPFTGSDSAGLAAIGVLALVAGVATLGAARRELGEEGGWSNS